jgi:phospholipid transport system substrate-binding protein
MHGRRSRGGAWPELLQVYADRRQQLQSVGAVIVQASLSLALGKAGAMKIPQRSRWLVPVAILGILLISCSRASALSPTDTLREFFRQAVTVVEDPRTETHPQEALRKIRKIADTVFDMREAAPAALGPHWNARSPAEREEFTRLFGHLLEQAYLKWITSLIGRQRIQIRYEDETRQGAAALVKTIIQAKDGRRVPFDYRMTMRQGRWTIRDVIVDGVSLIENYRAQFKHVLATAPYSALIASMRAKTTDDTAVSAGPTTAVKSAVRREVGSQGP